MDKNIKGRKSLAEIFDRFGQYFIEQNKPNSLYTTWLNRMIVKNFE